MKINKNHYIEGKINVPKNSNSRRIYRDWFLVQHINKYCVGVIMSRLHFPKHMLGKRVRFKVEVIED